MIDLPVVQYPLIPSFLFHLDTLGLTPLSIRETVRETTFHENPSHC